MCVHSFLECLERGERMNEILTGLRPRRKAAGLTLEDVAAAVGCTLQAVACWERGATLPTADRLPAIAKALGCSIDDLYKFPTIPPEAEEDNTHFTPWEVG